MDNQSAERNCKVSIGICLLVIVIGLAIWPVGKSYTNYTEKIDSLQSHIDSLLVLRDSIDQRIDTITVTIEKTHIQYEKDRNIILNNTTSEDYEFFLNYIRGNKPRLDSINNL